MKHVPELRRSALAAMAICVTAVALVQAQEAPPKTHMTIARPAELKGARAEDNYQAIRGALQENYAVSGDPIVFEYRTWRRFNTVPYRSTNHGERFVNNYANQAAGKYGLFEKAGEMPEGAVVVKDSFTVSDFGQVMTGPFFLMQKMERGFNRASGDWLFMMIQPDGKITGITAGLGNENVAFCAECHQKAAAGNDGLYFMPQQVRRRN